MTHFDRADQAYLRLLAMQPKEAIQYLAEQFSQVVIAERERCIDAMRRRAQRSIPVAEPVKGAVQ